MSSVPWDVEFNPACETWAGSLSEADAEALLAAVRVLRDLGPSLGRPLVDTISGSRHSNMKELRPGSTGRTEIRVLFAFDRTRRAILLVGGDKHDNWSAWYDQNIPVADDRFDEHQARIEPKTSRTSRTKGSKGRKRR